MRQVNSLDVSPSKFEIFVNQAHQNSALFPPLDESSTSLSSTSSIKSPRALTEYVNTTQNSNINKAKLFTVVVAISAFAAALFLALATVVIPSFVILTLIGIGVLALSILSQIIFKSRVVQNRPESSRIVQNCLMVMP